MKKFMEVLSMVALLLCFETVGAQVNYNYTWEASTGVTPGGVCPGYNMTTLLSGKAPIPILIGDTLELSTTSVLDGVYFMQFAPYFVMTDTLIVEFTMRFNSGTSSDTNSSSVNVEIGVKGSLGYFLIDSNEVFFWSDFNVKGPSAAVTTNDAFHTYRLEIINKDTITAYVDNALVLKGNMFTGANALEKIIFGQLPSFTSFGSSSWLSFRHNNYAFDTDVDGDGILDSCDNCPLTPNLGQLDTNNNGIGDLCDGCCVVPGDYDHDGSFNIADITAGIARTFTGGSAAICQNEADSNGDNAYNIADVTYGIARIFSGGPAPICGTLGT